MPGLMGPAGMRGQSRRVGRRTARRTARRQDMWSQSEPVQYAAPPMEKSDPMEDLRQLGQLHEAGIITDQEFAVKKAKLLDQI